MRTIGDACCNASTPCSNRDAYEGVAASAFATSLSARTFQCPSVMELAMCSASARRRAARPGSVAASAFATPLSARTFQSPSVMELAMCSARSGSVAADALTMSLCAAAFPDQWVMELAMRSASVKSRAAQSGLGGGQRFGGCISAACAVSPRQQPHDRDVTRSRFNTASLQAPTVRPVYIAVEYSNPHFGLGAKEALPVRSNEAGLT